MSKKLQTDNNARLGYFCAAFPAASQFAQVASNIPGVGRRELRLLVFLSKAPSIQHDHDKAIGTHKLGAYWRDKRIADAVPPPSVLLSVNVCEVNYTYFQKMNNVSR
jgi:hypothetical protein